MAYNIMKGTVEFSSGTGSLEGTVDLSSNQSVAGGKTFVQRITASAITLGGTPLVVPAITAISNDGANRVFTSDNDGTVTAQTNVTIANNSLTASFFSGSGIGLTSLQADQITGQISASQIHLGVGLRAVGNTLAVSASDGLSVSATGVTLDLLASHGLEFSGSSRELAINPSNPAAITDDGQSLADADSFIVYDASRVQTRKATAENVYTYINSKISTPAITSYTNASNNRVLTSVSSNTVNAEANLTFDGTTLSVGTAGSRAAQFNGHISASAGVHITGSNPKLSIGDAGDATANGGMLFIRPTDTSNRVLTLMQAREADGRRICFGVSGSGQVLAGGAHLGGVLNVSGAAAERLVSVKSDTKDPLFYIDGTGPAYLSGSQTLKTATPGLTLSSSTDSNAYARFVLNASKNILIENQSFNKHIVFKTNDAGSIKEGFRIDGAVPEVVVNQGSDSLIDFRVESNDNTHMIFSDGSANKVGINNNSPQLTLDVTGDVGVSNHIALNCDGTSDPSLYVNHAHIYSKLETGTAEVYVRDSDGNVTKISPHTSEGEWEYFSRNTRTGKVVRVNMERMIRKLEEFTGESFMEEWYEDPTD